MKIEISTIPQAQQRYATLGDYWGSYETPGQQTIVVSQLGDRRMEFLIGLHEMIESFLCEERGIAEPDIMAFDMAVPDDSPYTDDPGHDPAAPYHKEHVFAESIERLVAQQLGVNWQEYEARCGAQFPD